ncbi:MmcB family DNA repair protein [Paracoccus sp. p4-l81]|uniref:MmcB family DNA repair protein n=1 Tax=unclassified Paracoccus (in: a-proteobacteria) TaxID=2688777 RepID=UPI0035B7B6D4
MQIQPAPLPLAPGTRLARGVARMLFDHGFTSLPELVLADGLRADVIGLGPKGELWIIECKSGRADFRADHKWQGYLPWCDRFFWAVDDAFPDEILPPESGLIRADDWGAEILRMPDAQPLAGARRTALTRRIARCAMARLMGRDDPAVG